MIKLREARELVAKARTDPSVYLKDIIERDAKGFREEADRCILKAAESGELVTWVFFQIDDIVEEHAEYIMKHIVDEVIGEYRAEGYTCSFFVPEGYTNLISTFAWNLKKEVPKPLEDG